MIQGDHGSGSRLVQESAERTCLMERMRTTVAIYSDVPEIREPSPRAASITGQYLPGHLYCIVGDQDPGAEGQYFANWSALNQPLSLAGADFNRNCE